MDSKGHAIEESKDLGKKERVKSIALKAKKESSDDKTSTSESDDEEYAMVVRNFKKFFRRKGQFIRQPREEKKSFRQRDKKKGKSNRKCFRCSDPNYLIGNCLKPSRNKDKKAFIGGSWSDSENDAKDKTNDETCLMAQSSNECMRTRNSYFPNNSSATIPRRRNKRRTPNVVKPELCIIIEMADIRTMKELLQAPTEGYGEAIVIPEIKADHFEIKTNLLQLVQANPYHGFERENPHTHINNFKMITSNLKFRDVPNDVIKFMMFPYSLEGNARVWYDKEPPNSILTWEDLVNKFVNQFFPPSKTPHPKNEISRFPQRLEEPFGEACERFKEMLRACPHHRFTELAQIDTFYNGLNDNDQDSLNVASGENLLSKTTREALQIINNKSKVRYSRNKPNVSRMNTTSRDNASKSDDRIDKFTVQISTLVDIFAKKIVAPAPVKAVEESCVTCGGAHAYYNCLDTDNNQPSVCVATGTYKQVAPQNRASNFMAPPGFTPNQSSTSGTLSSNTIPNPNGEMKAITTRSGVAYVGPSIPTPKKVVEQETEETTDKEQINFQGSTVHIQPPVTLISKPDIPKTLPKPNIPYTSRLNDQKLHEKAMNRMEKFFQIFQDFTSTLLRLNENCSVMLLKKLLEKLGDPGKFLIPCDFSRIDTTRYSSTYDDLSVNRIDIIDVAREEYAQKILGFSNNSLGGNPTLTFEPILSDSSLLLTPFEGGDFIFEEIDAYLKDESISPKIDHADYDSEGDICLIEKLLNDDQFCNAPLRKEDVMS
nr:reverse transcriptase domain-containing protein [Tanacetum cinerariifolium]